MLGGGGLCQYTSTNYSSHVMSLIKKLLPRIARELLSRDSRRNLGHVAQPFDGALPSELRGQPMGTYLDQILCPSDLRNLIAYEADFQKMPAGGQYFVDVVQTPGQGCTGRSIIPTLDTHPKVYSFDHQRFATPMELSSAMGLDIYPGSLCGGRPVSPLVDIFRLMSVSQQLNVLGNGLHAPTMAAWYIYVLSNCVRIEFFYTMTMTVTQEEDIFESVD